MFLHCNVVAIYGNVCRGCASRWSTTESDSCTQPFHCLNSKYLDILCTLLCHCFTTLQPALSKKKVGLILVSLLNLGPQLSNDITLPFFTRIVKLNSPNLNYLLVAGVILFTLTGISFGLSSVLSAKFECTVGIKGRICLPVD